MMGLMLSTAQRPCLSLMDNQLTQKFPNLTGS
jgi:hypothetical protein